MYRSCQLMMIVVAGAVSWLVNEATAAVTPQIEQVVDASIHIRQDIQEKEEQWRAEKEKLVLRLDALQQEQQQLQERMQTLVAKVDAAKGRIAAKQRQLDEMEAIRGSIVPLTSQLIDELQAFVGGDLPFLSDERQTRIQRLIALRDDPEISVSEKYRKVLEAMLVETEYGSTIEVYQQTIDLNGTETLVDIFRLGRVCLFFQTLDQKTCGYFNVASKSWQDLDTEYSRSIHEAMEIGAKRRPVELLTLPLGRIALQ